MGEIHELFVLALSLLCAKVFRAGEYAQNRIGQTNKVGIRSENDSGKSHQALAEIHMKIIAMQPSFVSRYF